ncbi:MAG TPA: extracellular solute-binding protein [Clostridia bacterium]|nr:extracellular solute-binding protein [Clostridia bacterium]
MKKLWCLLLTAALLLSALSALAEVSAPGEFPICEKFGDITLKYLVTDHPAIEDWDTNEFVRWIEEKTNVDLQFQTVPLEGRAEKLNLILASGDYPDVFMSVGMTASMISRFGVQEGMFLPLQDLIEAQGVETKAIFEQYPGSKGLLTQLDGNIYSMPTVNECYHCTAANKFWINQKWLTNLGLETPTTLDEFYNVLVAFRDQDANGNGNASDEIPFAGDYQDGWNTNGERFILNAFTYYNLDLDNTAASAMDAFGLYLEDGTITVPFYKAELKDGLKYMAKLHAEGLYYPGSYTQTLNQLTQLAENDTLGASAGGYILFATLGGENYRNFTYLLPLVGPNGYQNTVSFPHDSVPTTGYVLSVDCANPEAAVKIADLLYTFEASMRGYYGVYGVDWTDPDEGALGINGLPALYKVLTPWQEAEPQNQHVVQMCISKRDAAFRLGETSPSGVDLYSPEGLETLLYNVTAEYKPFTRDEMVIPPLKFTDAETEAMSVIKAELATAIKEGMVAFMTGSRDADTQFDAWVGELQAKGLDTLISMHQAAYDAQYK